jgi:tetratricopeptide (TPR) repeat protein
MNRGIINWGLGALAIGATALVLWTVSGCTTDELVGPKPVEIAATDATEHSGTAGRDEGDLVSEMILHRAMYARLLRVLSVYYSEHGYENKAIWARTELKQLQKVRPFRYLMEDNSGTKDKDASSPLMTSLENPSGIELPNVSVSDRAEVDLVEELIFHRDAYHRLLELLATRYYSERGLENKANWARSEYNDFQRIKPYRYITDASAPIMVSKTRESVAEADKLFADAKSLMNKAGHRVPIFYNETTMNQALSKLMELVEKYPNSDKVAEAAYYVAEIHKEYNQERDNGLAIEWYKRAVELDPDLNHPAWSHAAHILDFRMHEREKALEWYQKVLEKEQGKTDIMFMGNIKFANERIKQLTKEETRRSPGEPLNDMRPEPTPSPAPAPSEPPAPSPRESKRAAQPKAPAPKAVP